MSANVFGWTLVLRGAGNSACRTTMMLGNATAQAPLNPNSVPASVEMFSEATIAAIQSPGTSSTIGLRFTRDGQGSKFIPSSCQLGFAPGTNNYADCLTYTTTYSSSPSWQLGGNNGSTTMSCSNPLGTSGGNFNQLVAMGLYDCFTCFDAWGQGVATSASVWVR